MPSRRHRSLTVTSRRNPPSTMRIFSSDVCLCRVTAFTLRTKDLASSLRSSSATALPVPVWDISAPLSEVLYLIQGACPTSNLSVFSTPCCVPLSLMAYMSVFGWVISVFTKNGGVFGIALSPVLATITKKGAWDLPNFCQSEFLTTGARGRTSRPPSR